MPREARRVLGHQHGLPVPLLQDPRQRPLGHARLVVVVVVDAGADADASSAMIGRRRGVGVGVDVRRRRRTQGDAVDRGGPGEGPPAERGRFVGDCRVVGGGLPFQGRRQGLLLRRRRGGRPGALVFFKDVVLRGPHLRLAGPPSGGRAPGPGREWIRRRRWHVVFRLVRGVGGGGVVRRGGGSAEEDALQAAVHRGVLVGGVEPVRQELVGVGPVALEAGVGRSLGVVRELEDADDGVAGAPGPEAPHGRRLLGDVEGQAEVRRQGFFSVALRRRRLLLVAEGGEQVGIGLEDVRHAAGVVDVHVDGLVDGRRRGLLEPVGRVVRPAQGEARRRDAAPRILFVLPPLRRRQRHVEMERPRPRRQGPRRLLVRRRRRRAVRQMF
mmetsp:Transcript_3796/g.12408  ORF Transcript_3796/g.12408 Transcript_3796/m.12408 type:complete len:384 (-) Transcript_3796:223-1374(-)